MAKGAAHYGDRNWEKGMPLSVFLESLMRHTLSVMQGKDDEDHLAAILFNAGAMIHGQEMIRRGIWPAEYADLQTYEEDAG